MRKFLAWVRFGMFVLWAAINMPVFAISSLASPNFRTYILRYFMKVAFVLLGSRAVKIGEVASPRPLMIVCNHLGFMELFALPSIARLSFFGKAEIRKWPVVGWIANALGVVFVDRRASKVQDSIRAVNCAMACADYPAVLFPEGTSTNGAYVKQFKSSLFNIIEPQLNDPNFSGAKIAIQPVVQIWKYKNGQLIGDEDLAQNYAYFNNENPNGGAEFGPKAKIERSGVQIAVNIISLGGVLIEYHFLPVVELDDVKDRKELAAKLHKIVSDEYRRLRADAGK